MKVQNLAALAAALGCNVWVNPRNGEERVYINEGVRYGEKAFVKDEGGVAGLQLVIVNAGMNRRDREAAVLFALKEKGIEI